MSKPREFYLLWSHVVNAPNFGIWDVMLEDLNAEKNQEKIHVIEYSAYQELLTENAKYVAEMQKITNGIPSEWAYAILENKLSELSENNRDLLKSNQVYVRCIDIAHKQLDAERAKSQKARTQCAALVEALEFYANGKWFEEEIDLGNDRKGTRWVPIFSVRNDHGSKAREALAAYKAESQEPEHE